MLAKSSLKAWIVRIIMYLLGQCIITAGMVFTINANIGMVVGSVVPYILSNVLGGWFSIGVCSTLFMILLILVQVVILRKNFKIIAVLQMVPAFISGYLLDFFDNILKDCHPQNYFMSIVYVLIGTLLCGIGIFLYAKAQIIPSPPEGLALAICEKAPKIKLGTAKNITDATLVLLGAILSLIFFGTIVGIREGTLITVLLIGRVIALCEKLFDKQVQKLFPQKECENDLSKEETKTDN